MAKLNPASKAEERILTTPAVNAILQQWKGRDLEHLNAATFAVGRLVPAGVLPFHSAKIILIREAERRGYYEDYLKLDIESCVVQSLESGASCPVPANDNEPQNVSEPCCIADPFELAAPGHLLSSAARWIYETSPSPNAEFAVLSAIALFAGLFGRKVITPDGLGLNMYLVMVGGTGVGKDRPLKALKQLASALGQKHVIGPNDFASDSALEYLLRHQPCLVLPMDEFGLVLSASGQNADSWSRARRKSLLELYSNSTSDWVAKTRASDGKEGKPPPGPIDCPTLSILGGTTPSTFYAGLEDDAFKSGLMARLLVVMVDNPPELQRIDGFPQVDALLLADLKRSLEAFNPGTMPFGSIVKSNEPPTFVTATWGDDAADELSEIRRWARHIGIDDERRGQVVNRAGDYTSKLATIRAISRDSSKIVVTVEDIQWAFGIVSRSFATVEDGAARFMSGSPFETLCNAIREAVRASKDPLGLKNSELLRKPIVKSAEPRMYDSALRQLLHSTGEIVNVSGTIGSGGKGGRYLLASGAP